MYTLIDLDRMVFVYKHYNSEVLINIALIEMPSCSSAVIYNTPQGYGALTDMELKLLYRHTTGQEHHTYSRPWLLTMVHALANDLPVLVANLAELHAQADHICGQEHMAWRYARGSNLPSAQDELFDLLPLKAAPTAAHIARADSVTAVFPTDDTHFAAVGPVGRVSRHLLHQAQQTAPTPGSAAPAPRPAVVVSGAVRGGGKTRDVIWSKADEMWTEAGKPTDAPVVLALRKKIMDALEVNGVKRTSSSNELGNWQKFRLAKN